MAASETIGQRFTQLIQQLGLSKNAFAQSLDKTATVIQHLVDERNKPGYDLLCKVFEVYPNVSKDWLLLGRGAMLLDGQRPAATAPASPPAAAGDPIDLATLTAPARRRAAASTLLQPAEVAETVALAGLQSTQNGGSKERDAVALPEPIPEVPLTLPSAAATVLPPPGASALPDPAYLAAMLQAQHLQHQLALAEQRNQHLVAQQQMLQQMVQLLQRS